MREKRGGKERYRGEKISFTKVSFWEFRREWNLEENGMIKFQRMEWNVFNE
jgi:hypothetical protein